MRQCFALDLKDDAALIAAYEERHRPGAVWPAVLDHIRASGVVEMEIWRTGNRLFMICEVLPAAEPAGPGGAESALWETEMDRYQQRLPHASETKWAPMQRIFSLVDAT